jgi:hypothetical protein
LAEKANESYPQEEPEKYMAEIKRLESLIADMKAKQDSTVTPLQKLKQQQLQVHRRSR